MAYKDAFEKTKVCRVMVVALVWGKRFLFYIQRLEIAEN